MPDFLIVFSIFVLQEHRLFALKKLRLADDPLTLLELVLNPTLLMNDAPVGQQGHRFPATEIQKHVMIGHEEHLLDLVQLLEAHDANLAGAGCRLEHEAELFLLSLANY